VLSIGKLGQGQESYYLEAVAQGVEDYYTGAGETPGQWVGSASAELQMDGEVEDDGLHAALGGSNPRWATSKSAARSGTRTTGPPWAASAGMPSIAHHVLQTLASFVELDPRGVLLRIGAVLEAGSAWGYQLELLAEGEFVTLVERYLASHRDLLMRDRVAREVLVRALESFVQAGWPSARRLMYGLDDMFR
jgi:hypothetical protein